MKIARLKLKRTEKNGYLYYVLFCPAYLSADKKRRQLYFRSRAEAERKRAELVAATRTASRETVLTNSQVVDAKRALERLADAGVQLSLDRAIELALPVLQAKGRKITVRQLLDDFSQLKCGEWRPHTARNFRTAAGLMTEAMGETTLTRLSGKDLHEWIRAFEPASYANWLIRTLRPAFSYAVRQDLIPESPFSKLEPIRSKSRAGVDVFTPEEARRLMEAAPEDCKAAFAVLLFAGVRPVELTKLNWGAVHDGFIHISPAIAKTAQVRNVEIEPTLAAWLKASGEHAPEEKLCPPNWARKAKAVRRQAGLGGRQDTARHSYASYHLAKYKDKFALEANLGHTAGSAMLMRHYRAAVTAEQAEEFWAIFPS